MPPFSTTVRICGYIHSYVLVCYFKKDPFFLSPGPSEILRDTFTSLGYDVKCFSYQSMNSIIQTLRKIACMPQHQNYDSFVCVLVSRGNSESVFGVDQTCSGFPLDHIRRMFMGDACPSLLGKPKLFFIQNYVVLDSHLEDCSILEIDGPAVKNVESKPRQLGPCLVHREADILWSLCKADVSLLERSSSLPSLYLKCLSQKLGQERWATRAVAIPEPLVYFSITDVEITLPCLMPFLAGRNGEIFHSLLGLP